MAKSRQSGGRGSACRRGQPPCQGARRAGGTAVCLVLAGCVEGPLSTLAPASDVTRSVAALWWSMAAGAAVILLLMIALAALALARKGSGPPGRRGILLLLVGGGLMLPGTVIAVLLLFGLKLDEAQWPPGSGAEADRAFHVDVVAHQWWWEARYPGIVAKAQAPAGLPAVIPEDEAPPGGKPLSEGETLRTVNVIHVPAGVPIHLRIMASDVVHGFWVPRIAGKLDAVPGRVNRIRLMVDEPGEYAGICAEYCGDGHAGMRFTLIAHPADELPARLAELAGLGERRP